MSDLFRVKLDENLGRTHSELLRESGYVVDSVQDEGLSGATDATLWQRLCSEQRFFVTLDLDFSDVRRFAPGSHAGILLLRPQNKSRDAVSLVLSRVIADAPLQSPGNCLAIADESRTRVRRPQSNFD